MRLWFLKKKENPSEKKIEDLQSNIKTSFTHIKKDMHEMASWMKDIHIKTNHHLQKTDHHERRIQEMETKLEQILLVLDNVGTSSPEKSPQEIQEPNQTGGFIEASITPNTLETINELTATQRQMFGTILSLQQQLGYNAISLKSLAKVMYPEKEYDQVRSTLSEYLSMLSVFGLIAKKRTGKESYVTVTSLGTKVGQAIKQEQIQRAKSLKKRLKSR